MHAVVISSEWYRTLQTLQEIPFAVSPKSSLRLRISLCRVLPSVPAFFSLFVVLLLSERVQRNLSFSFSSEMERSLEEKQ